MKKLFSLLAVFPLIVSAQSIDTVIHAPNYTSYYNYELHEPLYVTYTLFHGGGDCKRTGDHFVTDGLPHSALPADYRAGGYDEGHLANSKDFAYDCALQVATFRFYNCVPQTPRLNRGIWKQWETRIRNESQTDTLQVLCGSMFGDQKLGPGKIGIPAQCWKVVISHNAVIHCLLFPNNNSNTVTEIPISDLQKLLMYPVQWPVKF